MGVKWNCDILAQARYTATVAKTLELMESRKNDSKEVFYSENFLNSEKKKQEPKNGLGKVF